MTAAAVGDLLRHSLGLSAWKQFRSSRWSLRVNPSSGNLHPTEAYVVCGRVDGLSEHPGVYHYDVEHHALERRARFEPRAWTDSRGNERRVVLVALTSIHWRESWKYGERAFRYCQHDLGHAVAAISLAAAALGWRASLLSEWSHDEMAALTGIDRDVDYVAAEREEPACVLAVGPADAAALAVDRARLLEGVRAGEWTGRASQLSEEHVQWSFIDEIARATETPGHSPSRPAWPAPLAVHAPHDQLAGDFRALVRRRRSATAFDRASHVDRDTFCALIARTLPGPSAPWQALWWSPRLHLLLFIHRVKGVAPGLYLFGRESEGAARLRGAMRRDLLDDPAHDSLPLTCLARGDVRSMARRLSCDQDISADGFFSVAMLAEFDASLAEHGPSFYRQLFWESGVIGQVLYLAAEAAGARGTGIGCFYDDPVHDLLGVPDHSFQSLYHFTVGMPVDDTRLSTEPGYPWE